MQQKKWNCSAELWSALKGEQFRLVGSETGCLYLGASGEITDGKKWLLKLPGLDELGGIKLKPFISEKPRSHLAELVSSQAAKLSSIVALHVVEISLDCLFHS